MNRWEALDKKYVWHPFTQQKGWTESDQLVIERGEGVKLIDTDGREYYDGISSLWVNLHGHRRPEVDQAIRRQLDCIAHSTMLGLINKPASELAERLVNLAPKDLTKIFYSDDGSTAVEVALKMAFQYWQHKGRKSKQKFLTLDSAYHGDTIGSVSVGGIDLFHRVFKPLLFETEHLPCPSCFHCQLTQDKEHCPMFCADALEKILAKHHNEIAGLIVEPLIQAAAGMLMQPNGYLRRIREITKRYDVLLIADEVAVGFGRTGTMFACEQEGVTPDFMALSKGISAGYLPLAATLTTQEIYDAFLGEPEEAKTFYHGHSYTGNPLACAAALASLDIFEQDHVVAGLTPKIALIDQYRQKFAKHPVVGDARQRGMIMALELFADKEKKIPFPVEKMMASGVCHAARDFGLIIRNIGDVIIFMPPLASTTAELTDMLEAMGKALNAVCSGAVACSSDGCAF